MTQEATWAEPGWAFMRALTAVATAGIRSGGPGRRPTDRRGQSVEADDPRLRAALAGDAEALEGLFATHRGDVARLCRRMLGAGVGAEDAAQETFARARARLASYDPSRRFRPWLLSIASHFCIDALRRQRKEEQLFDASDLDVADLASAGPSPLDGALLGERREQLLEALDELPRKYRLPLVLRYFHEQDYAQIAEMLGVTRNQVGTLLLRARRRLRDQFSNRPGEQLSSEDAR